MTVRFQGYILGNPGTNQSNEFYYRFPFARGIALISDELYQVINNSIFFKKKIKSQLWIMDFYNIYS